MTRNTLKRQRDEIFSPEVIKWMFANALELSSITAEMKNQLDTSLSALKLTLLSSKNSNPYSGSTCASSATDSDFSSAPYSLREIASDETYIITPFGQAPEESMQ